MPRFIAQRGLVPLPISVRLTLVALAASQPLQVLLSGGAIPLLLSFRLKSATAPIQPHVVLQLRLFLMQPLATGSCFRPQRCMIGYVWHPVATLAKLRVAKFVRCLGHAL